VIHQVEEYNKKAGAQHVFVAEVTEQSIMDGQLTANRNGHVACTHGGECLAGLIQAREKCLVGSHETAILDSTAHALKFSGFQGMYFENNFPPAYEVIPDPELINTSALIRPADLEHVPEPGKPLHGEALSLFIHRISEEIAKLLDLQKV
jgi:threonine synthase